MAFKVVVLGAESTGTTTLARDLAIVYSTYWVPEYGRMYAEGTMFSKHAWDYDDFFNIALGQRALLATLKKLKPESDIIISDTDGLATFMWMRRYLPNSPEEHSNHFWGSFVEWECPELYILTGDEIPFVQDGTRDGEHIRHDMHKAFIDELEGIRDITPYIIVHGSKTQRLQRAVMFIDNMMKEQGYQD